MKVVFVKKGFEFEIRDVEIPEIDKNQALVKVKACGLCGTDLHTARIGAKEFESFGHEVTGIVEAVGENVVEVKIGDSVLLESGSFCRTCDLCRNGQSDLCNNAPNIIQNEIMGFSEYIVAPKECLIPFDGMGFDAGTLIEPLGVALDLFYTTDIKINDDVLVVGLGPIGLMALKLAKVSGARNIYGVANSWSSARIRAAKELGATDIILADKGQLADYKFPRGGVDKIMSTAPPNTIPDAMKVANIGAIIGFLGIEYGGGENITFNANDFHFKKLQLRSSFAAPALYFPRCVELIKSGVIDPALFISHTFKLDRTAEYMIKARDDKATPIKMVMIND